MRANITLEEAIDKISDAIASFIIVNKEGAHNQVAREAKNTLDHMIKDVTAPILEPILDLFQVEGNPTLNNFLNSTPWTEVAQKYAAGDML